MHSYISLERVTSTMRQNFNERVFSTVEFKFALKMDKIIMFWGCKDFLGNFNMRYVVHMFSFSEITQISINILFSVVYQLLTQVFGTVSLI